MPLGSAFVDRDVPGGEVCCWNLTEDDPDALEGRIDTLDGRASHVGDETAQLLRRAALDQGDLDEGHGHSPPLRKTEPRLVKCSATDVPGGENTASVMPPVSTIQPGSMA